MPTFATLHQVPFTPRQMFDLVADIESYPQFLPMCESMSVLRRTQADRVTTIIATMEVGYKAIRESFTTRVTLWPDDLKVLVEYLDGPFRRLENRWAFLPDQAGSTVDFYIDYEFRSAMLGLLVGALFDKAFRRFTAAFEERARVVYGATEQASRAGLSPAERAAD